MEYQVYDKFEYKVLRITNLDYDLEKKLNELGQEGWELISINKDEDLFKQLVLKRKLMCIKTDMINE